MTDLQLQLKRLKIGMQLGKDLNAEYVDDDLDLYEDLLVPFNRGELGKDLDEEDRADISFLAKLGLDLLTLAMQSDLDVLNGASAAGPEDFRCQECWQIGCDGIDCVMSDYGGEDGP